MSVLSIEGKDALLRLPLSLLNTPSSHRRKPDAGMDAVGVDIIDNGAVFRYGLVAGDVFADEVFLHHGVGIVGLDLLEEHVPHLVAAALVEDFADHFILHGLSAPFLFYSPRAALACSRRRPRASLPLEVLGSVSIITT